MLGNTSFKSNKKTSDRLFSMISMTVPSDKASACKVAQEAVEGVFKPATSCDILGLNAYLWDGNITHIWLLIQYMLLSLKQDFRTF